MIIPIVHGKEVIFLHSPSEPKLVRFCYVKHDSVSPIPSDRIPYHDLTYCISGEMHYVYEGKAYVLKEGDGILFPQGSVRTRKGSNAPAVYSSFNIACDGFTPAVCGYIPNCVRFDTVRIIESVKKAYDSLSEMKSQQCLSLFFYLYYQLIETVKNNEHPHVKRIKKYVAAHYKEKITLEEIAEAVHLTPQYCCALFSKSMGQTLFDFITEKRIEEAQSLMITTSLSLTEISALCGFEDYNYFSRIFKKCKSMNARQYRRLHTSVL